MNWLEQLKQLPREHLALCDIPDDPGQVTLRGHEESPEDARARVPLLRTGTQNLNNDPYLIIFLESSH